MNTIIFIGVFVVIVLAGWYVVNGKKNKNN
jgi:Na+/proline symporter